MKKNFIFTGIAAAAMLPNACQMTEPAQGITGETDFTVSASIPYGLTTYAGETAFSHLGGANNVDGSVYDLRYTLEVYDGDAVVYKASEIVDNDFVNTGAKFTTRLLAKEYDFVLWADFVNETAEAETASDLYYNTESLKSICYTEAARNENANVLTKDEADAYYAKENVDLRTSGQSLNVKLKRPFGKLRLIATDSNLQAAQTERPSDITMDFKGITVPTTFNALTGETSGEMQVHTLNFKAVQENASVNENIKNDAYLLGQTYFFTTEPASYYVFNVTVNSNANNRIGYRELSSIPVKKNKLTTVIGNFYTNEGNLEVIVNDDFDGEETEEISGSVVVDDPAKLQEAIDNAENGTVILVEPGNYTENYTLAQFVRNNGNSGKITVKGTGSAQPVFSGTLFGDRLSTSEAFQDLKVVVDGIAFTGEGTKIGNSQYNAIGDLTVQNCTFTPSGNANSFFVATNNNADENSRSTIRLYNNHIGNTTTTNASYYLVRLWAVKHVEVIGNTFEVNENFTGLQHINISNLSGSEEASIIIRDNTFTNGSAGINISSWKVGENPWSDDTFTGTIDVSGNRFINVAPVSMTSPSRNQVPLFISPEYNNDNIEEGRVAEHGLFDAEITVADNIYENDLRKDVIANLTVRINTVEELKTVLRNQFDGQTWYIAAGEYDVTELHEQSVGAGTKSSRFVITADNITINGIGNPVIKASADGLMQGGPGRWEYNQGSTILVYGKNTTIDGLTVRGIDCTEAKGGTPSGNKSITASSADDFTLRNSIILPAENNEGGSLIFDGEWSGKKATVENTVINGALITKYMAPSDNNFKEQTITLKNVEIDPCYNEYYYGPFSSSLNSKEVIKVDGSLKVHVYEYMTDFPEFTIQQVFDGIPAGTTVVLHGNIQGPVVNGGPYYTNTLKINNAITLTCGENAVISGIIELNAPATLDRIDYRYNGKTTIYGNFLVNSKDVTISNSVLYAEYDMEHCVLSAYDRDRSGEFGFIRPLDNNISLLNNTIQTNAMGIFGGSFPGAIIKGNIFKNLDGYTARRVWLNCASMNNLTIEGNTIYNRHMVLGGNATITGNRFLNLGENGTSGNAFYFWSEFTGPISGNEYTHSGSVQPLATGQNGVTIPEVG